MHMNPSYELISRKYADVFGATARPSYAEWIGTDCRAALGFRRANTPGIPDRPGAAHGSRSSEKLGP